MTPPSTSPAPSTSEPTGVRAQILAAASAEFAAHGLRAASVRTIAARAGTTAAMINYYFGGKRALYDDVVEQAQSQLFMMLALVMGEGDVDDLPQRLAGAYFDFLCEEHDLPRLLLREVLDRGEGLQTLARRYIEPMRAMFEAHFGDSDDAFQSAVSIFGAVAAYFTYAPVLTALLGEDPLAKRALARRRQHVMALAALVGAQNT